MRSLLFLIAAAGLFLLPAAFHAEELCDAIKLKEGIQAQLDTLEEDTISALREIIALAFGGLFGCSPDGYSFSDYAGAQPVLGPLAVAEGLHIITMTTEGSARIDGVALDGCGKALDGLIHNFSVGQGIRGAANLVEVESDCVFYLELSKITAPWSLTIESAP